MELPDFKSLSLVVARARVVMSVVVLVSIYVDPTTGGFFGISASQLGTLILHLVYGLAIYFAIRRRLETRRLLWMTAVLDVGFASVLAFVTEGPTSPSLALFLFAIMAAGCWAHPRSILGITLVSVALYLFVIVTSAEGITNRYLMRAAYLAIAAYLIEFFGQQRVLFEARLRELEAQAERHSIARSLHDGYIQALAGISLRLESCRDMLASNQPGDALAEIKEIQIAVAREYEEVRQYVQTLASAARPGATESLAGITTEFRVQFDFAAPARIGEQVMQIVLEVFRNAQRYGNARAAAITVRRVGNGIHLALDDDGVGFPQAGWEPPRTIASRVAEVGGRLKIRSDKGAGGHLEIEMPRA